MRSGAPRSDEERHRPVKGYAVILLDVHDPELYGRYAEQATVLEAKYDGEALIAADVHEIAEGTWPSGRIVVLEFPSLERARSWYNDTEYQSLITLRHAACRSRVLLIEGMDPGPG